MPDENYQPYDNSKEKENHVEKVNQKIINLQRQAEILRTTTKSSNTKMSKSFSEEFFKGVNID